MATAITLNANNGIAGLTNSAKVFSLAGLPETPDRKTIGSFRTNLSAPLGSPQTLLISHQVAAGNGSGKPTTDRHVLRFDFTKPADGDTPEATCSVYQNIVVPRVQFTAAEVKDMVGLMIDLINSTDFLDRILANDTVVDV